MSKKQLTNGEKIGELIFISYEMSIVHSGIKRRAAMFRCKCGIEFISRVDHVKYGVTKSCGCHRLNRLREEILTTYKHGDYINGIMYLCETFNNKRLRECLFQCPYCEKEFISRLSSIKNGHTKSCGCIKDNSHFIKHGMCGSSEYASWQSMKDRCLNPKHESYSDYGGRGIKIIKRWLYSFEEFYKDMGPKPSSKHTIERINCNGNYNKRNCTWATVKEQNRNQRRTKYLVFNGIRKPLVYWIELYGLEDKTVRERFKKGWPPEKILSKENFKNKIMSIK